MHSYARAERIWQSSSVKINPREEMRLECGCHNALKRLFWESEDFEKTVVDVRQLKQIWSKEISLGLDRQRWVEILNNTRWLYSTTILSWIYVLAMNQFYFRMFFHKLIFNLGMTTGQREGISWFQTSYTPFKNDLVLSFVLYKEGG